ncbi:MAG: hypothetical protein Q8L24_01970 [bacterium]|nr:hypothetical protein [bacterium]
MEQFKEIETDAEELPVEEKIEHPGLDRLQKELEKAVAEKQNKKSAEKPASGELAASEKETGPEQIKNPNEAPTKEEQLGELKKSILEMTYYDPSVWDKLREQSQETYQEALLEKSKDLAKRYLEGTDTPETKLLLDELKQRDDADLTNLLINEKAIAKAMWERPSSSLADNWREFKKMTAEEAENWLVRLDQKRLEAMELWKADFFGKILNKNLDNERNLLRHTNESARQLTAVIEEKAASALHKRFEQISNLKQAIKNGSIENMDQNVSRLAREKEICSTIINNMEAMLTPPTFSITTSERSDNRWSLQKTESAKLEKEFHKLVGNK